MDNKRGQGIKKTTSNEKNKLDAIIMSTNVLHKSQGTCAKK